MIAPSARWACDNLMIYTANHALTERLELIEAEAIDWGLWARAHGFLDR